MQVNFIGHGLLTDTKMNVGDQIATSFDSNIFDSFFGFVAFAASSGIMKLLPSIQKAQKQYKRLVFFIGVDNKGTSKEALELLLKHKVEVYIYHKHEDYVTYHPKLFLFEGLKYTRVIIGSSNLTRSGLINNIEASIQLDFQPNTDKQGNKLLMQIKHYFQDLLNFQSDFLFKLDTDLIKKYNDQGLLYSQFADGEKQKEMQPADGENNVKLSSVYPSDIVFGQGELPKDKGRYEKSFSLTEKDIESFDYFLKQYKIYKKEINPIGILNQKSENKPLYNWYRRIKDLIRAEQLPEDFAKRLDDAGFPLGDGKYANSAWAWEKNYQKLLQYMKDHNLSYAYVPQRKDRNAPDHALGYWYARQKLRRENKIPPPFLPGQFEKLQAINFKWESVNAGGLRDDDSWLENYFQLQEFKQKFHHANASQTSKNLQIKKLGKWLNDQITLHNTGRIGKNGIKKHLIKEREELLEELGVDWQYQLTKRKEELEKFIREYLKFIKIYPDGKPQKGDKKFVWVMQKKNEIKHRYKDENLEDSKWRRDRLRQVGINFW